MQCAIPHSQLDHALQAEDTECPACDMKHASTCWCCGEAHESTPSPAELGRVLFTCASDRCDYTMQACESGLSEYSFEAECIVQRLRICNRPDTRDCQGIVHTDLLMLFASQKYWPATGYSRNILDGMDDLISSRPTVCSYISEAIPW